MHTPAQSPSPAPIARAVAVAAVVLLAPGCSLRSYATRALADSLSGQGTGFASDEDPELVRGAAPFALTTMEMVLGEQPTHVGLLTGLSSGFTAYAYAFVQLDADELEERDVARARPLHARARRLYLRARDHGLRGLEVRHPGTRAAFMAGAADRRPVLLAAMTRADVPLLYWTAAAWALAVANGKSDMGLVGQLPLVEALMARAATLDADFEGGAIHEFYIAYEGGKAGGEAAARAHLERALALSRGHKVGVLVSFAETVDVATQNRAEFRTLLERALAFDADTVPATRLPNLLAQRRARWLLERTDDLFLQ